LYDKWWPILGVDAPEADHPLWATQDTNTRSGSDTWRCKECHGWDYKGADGAYGSGSHLTGFVGVLEAAAQGSEYVLSALMGETNPDHDFSDVFAEQDLADMALFIAETTVDYDVWVDADKLAIDGNLEDGQLVYEEICTGCHGPEGTAINFSGDDSDSEYVATIAGGNPWELLHKVRFGQPGTAMPSGIDVGLADQEYVDLLAHVQGLPEEAPALAGGRLYDKWWAALNIDAPQDDQPLWATQDTNTRSGSDTWRCKECHGWDYKGADGAYGSGSHSTGFPGILGADSKPAEELTGWLDGTANAGHDFSAFLDENQIGMLVTFMQTGMVDTAEYINDDKAANGDPAAGEKLYNVACSRCHGDDGKAINFGDEAEPEYLGDHATGNPWEFWHKASYGQPGDQDGGRAGLSVLRDLSRRLEVVAGVIFRGLADDDAGAHPRADGQPHPPPVHTGYVCQQEIAHPQGGQAMPSSSRHRSSLFPAWQNQSRFHLWQPTRNMSFASQT